MSETRQFSIGDTVFIARVNSTEKWIACPDCFGKRYLTVILGDESQVTIDCACCARGYEPSKGIVLSYYYNSPQAEEVVVCDIELREGKIRYNWSDEEDVFATEEEALARSVAKAADLEIEEQRRIHKKEKDTRTWSWNATYHRQQIRHAEKELAYHKSKLEAAKFHVKEEKEAAK